MTRPSSVGRLFGVFVIAFAVGCGGSPAAPSAEPSSTSTPGPSPTPGPAPTPGPTPAPPPAPVLTAGITFGPDIAAADQDTIRLAYSLAETFWGGQGVVVFAYSSIDAVLDAYTAACRCSIPSFARQALTEEFVTTARRVLLVVVVTQFHSMNRDLLVGSTLIHSHLHAVQRGYTTPYLDPIWMLEGNAEYADVHAGLRDVGSLHNFGRSEAQRQNQKLSEMERWPNDDGFGAPFGRSPYNLGHFATDLLVSRTSRGAIIEYWKALGRNLDRGMNREAAWREAFSATFNISVEQFYVDFEAYRARQFQ